MVCAGTIISLFVCPEEVRKSGITALARMTWLKPSVINANNAALQSVARKNIFSRIACGHF